MSKRLSMDVLLQRQKQFRLLAEQCDVEELTRCIRLLGMYLSLYKSRFGEMEEPLYAVLLNSVDGDEELEKLCSNGLEEAIAMLSLIDGDRSGAVPPARLRTLLN